MLFDLKHAFYAMAGSAVAGIAGYLFGVALYVLMICSSAFTTNPSIATLVTSAGIFPVLFAVLLAAIGFFAGWWICHEKYNTPIVSNNGDDAISGIMQQFTNMVEALAKAEVKKQSPSTSRPPDV